MAKLHLLLFIHAHQPVGNFDRVVEQAYQSCYLPFLEVLGRYPSVRVALHYSGPLFEWLEERHPEFFPQLGGLVVKGQVELLGGGFYEPILVAIPPEDQQEQLRRTADYIERHFGSRPRGAWLAERVWEPQLPAALAQAGIEYTLVDDTHFLASGFEAEQMHAYYLCEEQGQTVKVVPGLKALRYLIPFRSVDENLEALRGYARARPSGLAALGDDCEKFGVWPGTYEHCYRDGWLERFFTGLESNSDWLATPTPSEFLASHPPLGRASLPAASYPEMMEWVLPTAARQRFHTLQREFAVREDMQPFLRGGFWRGFLDKYAEANLLHKKMLRVSGRIRGLAARSPVQRRKREEARTHLLRAQCNDAYWHGIFGGLYSPNLRTAVWRELIRAEKLSDEIEFGRKGFAASAELDYDADGHEEIHLSAREFAAVLKPGDGGTLAMLDFRPSEATLINSIMRRPEAYHARLREAGAGGTAGVASIHEQTRVKESGLEQWLRYDRWPRHAFRLLVFDPGKSYEDYAAIRLEEDAPLAGGMYGVVAARPEGVELACESGDSGLCAQKKFSFLPGAGGLGVSCEVEVVSRFAEPRKVMLGLEVVLNLLAPNSPDRYFEAAGARHPLEWSAAVPACALRVVDEWQNLAATLEACGADKYWIAPIETVSESEEGFERVYQGSQILAVWRVELNGGKAWTARLNLGVRQAR